MIFLTGDIHGGLDIHKLSARYFDVQTGLTRSDYLIICGDFGLLWDGSKDEKFWLDWLDKKPWTTLWIDGNHENFDMIKEYPTEEWHGGKVQKITDNIIHLCRGSMFEIDGKRIFAFGGAERVTTKNTAHSANQYGKKNYQVKRRLNTDEKCLNR